MTEITVEELRWYYEHDYTFEETLFYGIDCNRLDDEDWERYGHAATLERASAFVQDDFPYEIEVDDERRVVYFGYGLDDEE